MNWLSEPDTISRAGLRELNDLTTMRFETKLEQRVTQCETRLEQRVTQREARLEQRLAALEARHWTDIAKAREDFDERLFLVFLMCQVPFILLLLLIGFAGR